jgi:hypothetical protein
MRGATRVRRHTREWCEVFFVTNTRLFHMVTVNCIPVLLSVELVFVCQLMNLISTPSEPPSHHYIAKGLTARGCRIRDTRLMSECLVPLLVCCHWREAPLAFSKLLCLLTTSHFTSAVMLKADEASQSRHFTY